MVPGGLTPAGVGGEGLDPAAVPTPPPPISANGPAGGLGWPPPPPGGYPPGGYPPGGYPFPAPPGTVAGLPGVEPSSYPQGYYAPPPGVQGYPGEFAAAAKPEPIPVEPQEYHQFYRAPAFRWWKPIVAVLLFGVAWFVASIPPVLAALAWDASQLGKMPATQEEMATPAMFVANNVSVGLMIPAVLLVSWLVFRQRPRWLSSVVGGLRWPVLLRFFAIALLGIGVAMAAEIAFSGGIGELSWTPTSLFLIISIVITTPFQAAGEEYAVRGLLFRGVGSWFRHRWVGLGVGIAVNAVAFMLLHGAGDPWLNVYYLLFGGVFSLLVWRTGGLEAAIAMHVANNLISEVFIPFQPDALAHIFDRQAGVAGPETLIQMAVTAAVGAVLWWQGSRLGLTRSSAPAAVPAAPVWPVVAPAPGYPVAG